MFPNYIKLIWFAWKCKLIRSAQTPKFLNFINNACGTSPASCQETSERCSSQLASDLPAGAMRRTQLLTFYWLLVLHHKRERNNLKQGLSWLSDGIRSCCRSAQSCCVIPGYVNAVYHSHCSNNIPSALKARLTKDALWFQRGIQKWWFVGMQTTMVFIC